MNTIEATEKLSSLFKEEMWGRIEPRDIGISKFKILEDYFNGLDDAARKDIEKECHEHLKESEFSINAFYLLGLIAYHFDTLDGKIYLKKLIDLFLENNKWAVVEHIAEKVLEFGENRIALKALATALERLGRLKEAIPIWEDLLKIDRFDAGVAKKLSFAILADDKAKSIQYMKIALEGFVRNRKFDGIEELWEKLIPVAWDDLQYFERIERMLVDASRKDLAASMLKVLFVEYKENEIEQAIVILNNILRYNPKDIDSRKSLISLYEKKYGDHSQFKHFLDLSRLKLFSVPVNVAVEAFENNIIFDKGNYVFHRSWGLGSIKEITSDSILIDFRDKKDHKMSVDMALQSLQPINKDHFYVKKVLEEKMIKDLFEKDFLEFLKIMILSFDNKITVSTLKLELIPEFVDQKNWSKWWSKIRTQIKKSSIFTFSEKQKDLILMREKPITFADELIDRFRSQNSFSSRLSIAYEFVNNIDEDEGQDKAKEFIDYFKECAKSESNTKLVLSYFILNGFSSFIDEKDLVDNSMRAKVIEFIKTNDELPIMSKKITSYDYKKEFINLIKDTRGDWQTVLTEILFELPVRIHKYIINKLIMSHSFSDINKFLDRIISNAKRFPEIFLWVAKNLLTKIWDYDWLDYSRQQLILALFRVLNELNKFETKGNRLKNIVLGLIFEGDKTLISEIIDQNETKFLHKLYDLALNAGYVEDAYINNFLALIKAKDSSFNPGEKVSDDEKIYDEEQVIVSQEGFNKKQEELNHMVNIEMPKISKDLSDASDISGDLRENVDYNALMEKQAILKIAISKLGAELKSAKIINFEEVSDEFVSIGTTVEIETGESKDKSVYSILGPWDADYEKNILSYRSPMARLLLKKKPGDIFFIKVGEENKEYKVISIKVFSK